MSSATQVDPNAGRKIIGTAQGQFMDRSARLGMTPRQRRLNQLYAYYRCLQYDARKYDWDGRERLDPVDREAIAAATFIPPGFVDMGGKTWPLKFRKPSAPYNLAKVIVDRFTGLLFSERHHPQPRVEGEPVAEDYVQALAEAGRLWPAMIQARTYGGAMGSTAVGFQFVNGRTLIEAHDPRWLIPKFKDRATLELESIEKRYIFPMEVFNEETEEWEEQPFWYRRIITDKEDVLWHPISVGEGGEPNWTANPDLVARYTPHDLGFCPVVWIQNTPVADDIDGDPDCLGIYDEIESIDALLAQAQRGILANCDPTVVVVSPDKLDQIKKGNENAIKLTAGSANYMEANMVGPKQALEMAEILRRQALEVAQCVLEHPDTAQKTATEIERSYSSMLSKADVLREQYGERGVKPLLEMMVKAVRMLGKPRVELVKGGDGEGEGKKKLVSYAVQLPPRVIKEPDGTARRVERRLTQDLTTPVNLQWPGYFDPSLSDANTAVQAAGQAKLNGLIDEEHAAQFVAPHFKVEDVTAMLARIKEEQQARQGVLAEGMLSELGQTGEAPIEGVEPQYPSEEEEVETEEEPQDTAVADIELTSTDLATVVTVNEARRAKGLPDWPDEDGKLTIAAFQAKHQAVVAAATQATEGQPDAVKPDVKEPE